MTFFHRIFHRNLPIKIMAILTATVLWFYVMNNQNPSIEATIKREVQLVNIPDGKVVSLEENKVNIKVRALRSYFVSTAGNEFRAELDAEDLPDGRIRERVNIILPHGFELIEVDPPELLVFVDPIEKKLADIKLITTGSPAEGITLASVSGDLKQAEVIGPASRARQVSRLIAYVPLNRHDTDFSQQVPLLPVNNQGRVIEDVTVAPTVVVASVQLARGLSKKIVTVSPVLTGRLPEGLSLDKVSINPAKIEITGRKEVIDKLQSIATREIDLSEIEPENIINGTFSANVLLRPIQDVVVIDRTVKVDISTKEKAQGK